jgi:hypothetical protein
MYEYVPYRKLPVGSYTIQFKEKISAKRHIQMLVVILNTTQMEKFYGHIKLSRLAQGAYS